MIKLIFYLLLSLHEKNKQSIKNSFKIEIELFNFFIFYLLT